jgi:hypothetical protein
LSSDINNAVTLKQLSTAKQQLVNGFPDVRLVDFQQTCIKVALTEGDVSSNGNIIMKVYPRRDLIASHLLSVAKGTYSELLK